MGRFSVCEESIEEAQKQQFVVIKAEIKKVFGVSLENIDLSQHPLLKHSLERDGFPIAEM